MDFNKDNSRRLLKIFNVDQRKAWEIDKENVIRYIPTGLTLTREGTGDSSYAFSTSFPRYDVHRNQINGNHGVCFNSNSVLYRDILNLWEAVEEYHDSDERLNDDLDIFFSEKETEVASAWEEGEEET